MSLCASFRLSTRTMVSAIVIVGAVCMVPGPAQADPAPLMMTWDVTGDGMNPLQYNWNDYGGLPAFGDYTVDGSEEIWTGWNYSGDQTLFPGQPIVPWALSWDVVFNDGFAPLAGPGGAVFVTANIVVTNNDQINTQNFSLLMSLPIANPILSPTERGSLSGTVSDLTFDNALVSAPVGGSIYTARIDTVNEALLLADPFSQSAGFLGTSPVGPADFGVPSAIPASQDVNSSIAIFLSFDLSPGDSASFTAIFEVIPIPGPGGLPLLAVLALLPRRRRRS